MLTWLETPVDGRPLAAFRVGYGLLMLLHVTRLHWHGMYERAVRTPAPSAGVPKRCASCQKSQYPKYPPVAPRNPPRVTRDARGRLPNTVGARRCKRGKI